METLAPDLALGPHFRVMFSGALTPLLFRSEQEQDQKQEKSGATLGRRLLRAFAPDFLRVIFVEQVPKPRKTSGCAATSHSDHRQNVGKFFKGRDRIEIAGFLYFGS